MDQLSAEQAEAPVEEIDAEAEPETVSEAPETAPRTETDVEARAREQGWVPKEEFRGDPNQWRSAEDFVRRGEEILPIVRKQLHETQARLKETETTFQQRIERMERMNEIALRRQREAIEAQYYQAKAAAVADGDTARWQQLERDQAEALRHHDTQVYETLRQPQQPQPQQQPDQLAPHQQAVISDWVAKNPWFDKDPEMHHAARGAIARIEQENPYAPLEQILDLAAGEVRKRYSDRLEPRQARQAAVQGGTRVAASRSNGRGAADLPAEARQAGERFVKEGVFKDLNAYAKEYWAQG